MPSLRSLVVSLEANIAKYSTDMKSASDVTTKAMNGIQDSIKNAKSEFLNLAASVVSVGAVMKSVKDAIQLGDDLKQMSDSTGVAIAKLDELSIIAKLNGADLDAMAKGFKGLGKAIIESQDATSKQAQLFSALGVAVKDSSGNLRGVEDVMGDVAKALNSIENETTRAAVGTALFGKSYLQIAASLRNFETDQLAANDVLEKFGRVSTVAANLSDELGDKLTLLGEGSKRALLSGLVPGLAAAAQAVQELINSGGSFQTSFGDVISKVVEFVSTALVSLGGAFRVVGTTIAAVAASIATGSLQPLKDLPGEIAKIEAQVIASQGRIRAAAAVPGLDDADQISRAAGAQDRLNKTQADGAKLARILGDANKGAKDVYQDYAEEIQKLNDQMAKLAGTDGGYAHMIAAQQQIFKDLRDGKIITNQAIDAYIETARALDEQEAAAKALAETWAALEKAVKAAADAQKEIDDAMLKANQSIKAQNDALELEHATLGLTDNARRQFITTLELEKAQLAGNTNAVILLTKQLDLLRQQAADNALLKMAEEAKRAFEAATAFASDFFVDLFNNGSKAFKNLWENFKQLALRALAEVAAKQVVVSIVGALGGVAAGPAGAAGGGDIFGTLASLVGGGSKLTSLFSGGGGGFNIGSAGFGMGDRSLGTVGMFETGGSGLGGIGSSGFSLGGAGTGAAIGAGIGWGANKLFGNESNQKSMQIGGTIGGIAGSAWGPLGSAAGAAIGSAIGSLFKSKTPKEGGFGEAGVTTERFFSQSQFDDTLNKATAAMVANFDHLNATLGGTLRAGFAQGIYGRQGKEKEGTTAAFVGGQEVFRSTGVSLGKDEASITAALAVESKRAILAALQASDIAPRFAEIIDSVAAASASSADVDRLLGLAQSLQMVEAALGPLNVNLGETGLAAAEAAQQLIDASGGADQFASKVSAFNDTFLTENERLDTAFSSLRDSFVQIGVSMPTSVTAFRDLVESLDLTTQAGRETWSALLDVAPAFASVTNAVQAMITDIYSLQDSIHGVSGGNSALNQLNAAIDAFVGAVPGFAPLLQSLGTEAFAANLANIGKADLANYSPSNIGLIQGVLAAYNALLQAGGGAGGGETGVVYPGQPGYPFETGGGGTTPDVGQTAEEMVADLLKRFSDLVNQSTGNYGEKLALQIKLATGAIADAGAKGLPAVAALLQATNTKFAASLALFNDLSGRYTDQIAEQLVKLTESYNQQAQDLAGNANALDVLNVVFEEQWTEIINGTAAGVDGTLEQLRKLQEGILDYVTSLQLSADSPLTASQKLEQARTQYEATLAKASAGDQAALSAVTGAADVYIKLARDFYASSAPYADLFAKITGQLTTLGNFNFGGTATPTGTTTTIGSMSVEDFRSVIANTGTTALVPPVANTDVSAFRAQPPAGTPQTPLADQAVIENVAQTISDAVYDAMLILARSNTEDAAGIKGELERTKSAIVDAITLGWK